MNDETEEKDQIKQVPIVKLLENRNRHIKDLQNYWESKAGTIENQIAQVSLEILGVLVTSVITKRSFSRGRYVLNEQGTNLSPGNTKLIKKTMRTF